MSDAAGDGIIRCASCKAPIEWAQTAKGKSIPLDPELAEDSPLRARANIVIAGRLSSGTRVIAVMKPGEGTYVTHFATCPHADDHRRK